MASVAVARAPVPVAGILGREAPGPGKVEPVRPGRGQRAHQVFEDAGERVELLVAAVVHGRGLRWAAVAGSARSCGAVVRTGSATWPGASIAEWDRLEEGVEMARFGRVSESLPAGIRRRGGNGRRAHLDAGRYPLHPPRDIPASLRGMPP